MKLKKWKKRIGLTVTLVSTALITIGVTKWILSLRDPSQQLLFKEQVTSLGAAGWLLLLGLQILQVVIAFIPGEPVELLAGVTYGTIPGLITCLLGVAVGSTAVFYLVRRFGSKYINLFFERHEIANYKFLNDPKRMEILVFLLFFLPGTPKDLLTYVAALSPIKTTRFLVISSFARIPSVVTSTMMGDSLINGRWQQSLIIFSVTGILGITGILVNRLLTTRLK